MKRIGHLIKLGTVLGLLIVALHYSCGTSSTVTFTASNDGISLDFDDRLFSRVVARVAGEDIVLGNFTASESISISGQPQEDFVFQGATEATVDDEIGAGTRYVVSATAPSLLKAVTVTAYDDFPTLLTMEVAYTNTGTEPLPVDGWTNHAYAFEATGTRDDQPSFWAYQSGSYESRADWVLPLTEGFSQQNYMGMNNSDYGGGTPVVDLWRPDVGLGVGHLETTPRLVSLPTAIPGSATATVAISRAEPVTLEPGATINTLKTFVAVHTGDYFQTLATYRQVMARRGINFNRAPASAFEPVWCAWGYERDFTMDQVYGTLPMVKQLGFKWAVLDDGWQTAEGDWYLVESKFPNGDADMIKLVDNLHAQGLKAKLWWAPLAVDPGTDLIREHPEYLLLNADGSTQDITWWDSYYLCPAAPGVLEFTRRQVTTFMETWGYDGLKIDGQHLNGVPPCYNEAHNHAYPEESVERLPEFFRMIYETAHAIKPEAVTEVCPCGTAYNFFMLPYIDQAVSSDPLNSWQIRLKGKTIKALAGNDVAYYGDHVELSDNRTDFASTMGVGGVLGTKFVWPVGAKPNPQYEAPGTNDLTPEKEAHWDKWMRIWEQQQLYAGTYRGDLYDLGFDRPEAHAIEKEGDFYYAFYGDHWEGPVELRGLSSDRQYRLRDYVNDVDLGVVTGPEATVRVAFDSHLLLEALAE